MKDTKEKQKGITLVALVITIIVMLILVSVTIRIVIETNLIGTAQDATDKTANAYKQESNLGNTLTVGNVEYGGINNYMDVKEGKKILFKIHFKDSASEYTFICNNGATWAEWLDTTDGKNNQLEISIIDDDLSTRIQSKIDDTVSDVKPNDVISSSAYYFIDNGTN